MSDLKERKMVVRRRERRRQHIPLLQFTDRSGQRVRIDYSSAAEESCCRVFLDVADRQDPEALLLNEEHTRMLIAGLELWLKELDR